MADSVFELQDVYDLEFASDRRSRFGAYLMQNARRFRDWDGALTDSPVEFAAAAFVLATVPVMSPPYVSTHPRVVYAAARFDEDGRCGLVLELAAPMATTVADQLPPHASGWGSDPGSGRFFPPEDNGHLAVYSRLTARIPFPIDALPEPVYTDTGVADMETVKHALRVLANHANSVLGPVIATLDNDSSSSGGVGPRSRRDRYVTGSGHQDRAQG
jgi:hypothetical protein